MRNKLIFSIIFFIVGYFIYASFIMPWGTRYVAGNFFSNPGLSIFTSVISMAAPIIIFLFLFLFFLKRPSKKQQEIMQNGTSAEATILKTADTGMTFRKRFYVVKMLLSVKPQFGEPFEVQTEGTFSRVSLPRPGDKVMVKFDPNDKSEVVLINNDLA